MSKFGQWPLSEEFGPQQSYFQIVPNAAQGANTGVNYTVGTYTMPFAGKLIAEFKGRCTWTVDQTWFRAWLSNSTPGPSSASQHAKWTGNPGGYTTSAEIPLTASWDSLAKGQVVTLIGYVGSGTLGGLTMVSIGGLVRASPI